MSRFERWGPVGFVGAGVLMLATIGYGGLGEVAGLWPVVWPLVVVGFGGTILAGVLGLLGLYPGLDERAPRLALVAAAAALIAGLGAVNWIVTGALGLSPWDLPEAYASVVLLGGLVGFLAAFLLFGLGIVRTGSHPRRVGVLLVLGGLSFLGPIADEALGWGPPEWLPVLIFGLWGGILFSAGAMLRAGSPARFVSTSPSRG